MTREDIRKNIEAGAGKWEPEPGFIFTLEDEEKGGYTIHCRWAREGSIELWGFLIPHNHNEMGGFHFASHTNLFHIGALNEFAVKLAQHLNFQLDLPALQNIERIVNVSENSVAERLAGKVEAYENILIGRSITAS